MSRRACRWPGCTAQVPANMWGCKPHWFRLPKSIRDRIWATYRPGQEDDLRLSREYVAAEREAREWARWYEEAKRAKLSHQRSLFDE